jgi:hypothetical protein
MITGKAAGHPAPARDRFGFGEDAAREFIARALRRGSDPKLAGVNEESLELPPRWNPRGMYCDEMWLAEDLIAGAIAAQAIICPAGTDIQLICMADGDGGMYMWRIRTPQHGFALASEYMAETRRLGDGSKGALGALSVIREAVNAGNLILDAHNQTAGRQVAARLLAKISQTGEPGGDVAGLLNDCFTARGLDVAQAEDHQ